MKTLIISSEFPPGPGGIGQHAASFAKTMSKDNQVIVLANQDYTSKKEIVNYQTTIQSYFKIVQFAPRKSYLTSFIRIRQAILLVKELEPDKVYVTGRFPLWVGALIKLRYPKQSVEGFVHGTEVSFNGSIISKITVKSYSKLDRIIAVSNYTANLLKVDSQCEKVKVLPNGIDRDFLKKSEHKESIEPFDWVGSPKLLTVGNVTPRKGQHRVVKALPEILKYYPKIHYHIVGLPTYAEDIFEFARRLGVKDNITIHGRLNTREELYRAYRSCDIFIMLSENQQDGDLEGFGIAILEANAFALPAIGAVGCGIEDAISDRSGILVNGDDTNEICEAMNTIQNEKEVFSKGARKWAEQHDWTELVKSLVDQGCHANR